MMKDSVQTRGEYRGVKDWEQLTTKQQDYINHFLSNGHNSVQARLSAGYYRSPSYNTNKSAAHKLRYNKHIDHNIRMRMSELQMSEEEALKRHADQGRFDAAKYLVEVDVEIFCEKCNLVSATYKSVSFDLEACKKDGYGHLIKKVTPTKYGLVVDFYPADAARKDIMTAHGTFVQKHEKQLGGLSEVLAEIAAEREKEERAQKKLDESVDVDYEIVDDEDEH